MIVNLSRGLADRGHHLVVGLFRKGWLYEQLSDRHVQVTLFPWASKWDPRPFVEIARFIRNERVQVVHAHEFGSIIGGSMIRRWTSPPLVATVHGREYLAVSRRRQTMFRWLTRPCDRIVAVSNSVATFLSDTVRVSAARIETIYNGIDLGTYHRNGKASSLRLELGIGPEDRVITAVGSLYPVKGQRFLIRAMPAILHRVPTATCLLVGHGHLRTELEREVQDMGLGRSVHFLGYRQDVPALLGMSDLFVLPSLSEGLPLSLLEAMAAGCPVVATSVGGNTEVVRDGVTGYLLPPERPDLIADRIIRLLVEREAASAMVARAQADIKRRFSAEAMVDRYERLFERTLGERQPERGRR
jgi:glycosyltransferase involved in cell wall biosynthesis